MTFFDKNLFWIYDADKHQKVHNGEEMCRRSSQYKHYIIGEIGIVGVYVGFPEVLDDVGAIWSSKKILNA